MAKHETMEAAGGAETAATGYIGKREGGEAQQVVDEAQTVDYAEIVAGLASETADETAKVAIGATEALCNGFQTVFSCCKRLQEKVSCIKTSGMKIALQWRIDSLPILVIMAK